MPTTMRPCLVSFLVSGYLVLFTALPVNLFIAPLVMLLYRSSFACTVVVSFCTGCFLDLVFLTPRFGFLGLSLALASWSLYDVKKYFFEQQVAMMFIVTFLFSEVYTAIQYGLAAICSLQMPKGSFLVDFFLMPLFDAAAAWVVFYVIPLCFQFCMLFIRTKAR
jgi:hypothetical protein